MARQLSPVENHNFAQGLITEVSPLTFPPNGSVDEVNFELRRNLTRRRRLGNEAESGYQVISSGFSPTADNKAVFHGFTWENAGGDAEKQLGVVQVGNVIKIFDTMTIPVSNNLIYTYTVENSVSEFFSFAAVDGILVVATGAKNFLSFTYEDGAITVNEDYLRTRDLFGVEDTLDGVDLTSGSGLTKRPSTLTDQHRYNLRNQSWSTARAVWSTTSTSRQDPVVSFRSTAGVFPSNSDAVYYAVMERADSDAPELERFYPLELVRNPFGSTPASRGSFVIDAMERGASRVAEYASILSQEGLSYPLTTLPTDRTPGGPSVIGEFAGRVWFGGFSGEVVDGDEKSPYLSSYVMFSKLVSDFSDLSKCYQIGDPTSKEESDILATDGGFIRIAGAYGIVGLKALSDGLLVIAANGVWRIAGGDAGFDATDYLIEKISEYGCNSPNTIVEVDGSVLFWGTDGIYLVARNELGDFKASNLSQGTIQQFYDAIPFNQKKYCSAIYDSFDRKIRWIYGNLLTEDETHEIVFDVATAAFFPNTYKTISGNRPKPVCAVRIPPYRTGSAVDVIVTEGTVVTVEGEPVVVSTESLEEGFREILYVTLLDDLAGELRYTFSSLSNEKFLDWEFYDSTGIDAEAFMITGYLTGGDSQRDKGVYHLTMHFERTETGFEADDLGDLYPKNPSSCIVRPLWEWTNTVSSNRWGRPFQAYRYRRLYIPQDVNDTYDTGHELITTSSRLRGKGKALSLLIKTEPGKDCRVLGWAMVLGVQSNV